MGSELEIEWESGIEYEHACRECGKWWVERYHLHETPPTTCPRCGSDDTYRCVGSKGFRLEGGGVGWARDGYYSHNNLDQLNSLGNKVLPSTKEEFEKDLSAMRNLEEGE